MFFVPSIVGSGWFSNDLTPAGPTPDGVTLRIERNDDWSLRVSVDVELAYDCPELCSSLAWLTENFVATSTAADSRDAFTSESRMRTDADNTDLVSDPV